MNENNAMLRMVLLVGTDHNFQCPWNSAAAEFRSMIKQLVSKYQIQAIAEEFNEDGIKCYMKKDGVSKGVEVISNCKITADSLEIPHLYADPSQNQRDNLGILTRNRIKANLLTFSSGEIVTDADLDSKDRQSRTIREKFWRDEIIQQDIWPTLFVCGAHHVETFSNLLQESQLTVETVHCDWPEK